MLKLVYVEKLFFCEYNMQVLTVSWPLFLDSPVSMQVSLKKGVFHSYLHENKYFQIKKLG